MPTDFLKPVSGCFFYPQGLEGLLAALPRKWLDEVEIRGLPRLFSDEEFSRILDFWRERRVAFVRQTTCMNAYQPKKVKNWIERVFTASWHPGPFSFLHELKADYFVVRQATEPETFAWREKHLGDPDLEASSRMVQEHCAHQEFLGKIYDVDEVSWKFYDLVVCIDIPIPTRITQKAKHTLWAYLSIEAGGKLQKESLQKPVLGYHIFMNHSFRRFRIRPQNHRHTLEFPFAFQSGDSWKLIFEHLGVHNLPRKGILADLPSATEIPEPRDPDLAIMRLHEKYLHLEDMARLYARHKYALRLDPRPRWGNWLVEVIQAGCLFLGRPDTLDNISPLLPGLAVRNYPEARKKIDELEGNPDLFAAYRVLQSAITEHVAFRRPLADLTARARRFFDRSK